VISLTSTLVDYQFNVIAEQSFQGKDALTGFFGTFFASINTVAFLLQFLLVGRVLSRYGVGVGLLFLPMGLFLGSLWFLWLPTLWSASFIKMCDDGFSNSINKSSLEILYLPVPIGVKNRTKAWLDMFVDRTSRGVGGVLILLATTVFSLSVHQVSLIVLGLVTPWLGLAVLLQREYVKAFRTSLGRRDIDVAVLTSGVHDQHSVSVLQQVLSGSDEKQVLYALDLLRGTQDEGLLEPAERLTAHPSSDVRASALRLLCSYAEPPYLARLETLTRDPSPTVRAEALALLYKSDHARGKKELDTVLGSGDVANTHAVLDCMEASPELLEGVLDESFADRYHRSDSDQERELAARAIGFVSGNGKVHSMLSELLGDRSLPVARAAAASAGRLRDDRFLPLLIQQLRRRPLRAAARTALGRFGGEVVESVGKLLLDEGEDIELRRALPAVLAEFESQTAVNRLFSCLPDDDLTLHYQAIKSLGKMRARYPHLRLYKSEVDRLLRWEAVFYCDLASKLTVLRARTDPEDSQALLDRALEERWEFTRDRIFRLLGLVYPAKDIFNSWNGLVHGRPAVRAAALEFLENLLSQEHKETVLPLIEAATPEEVYARGKTLFDLPEVSLDTALAELVTGKDAWLAACAVTMVGTLGLAELRPIVESVQTHPDPVTRESAQYTLRRLQEGPS
jgi:AAA family ATP:ADP antiporter